MTRKLMGLMLVALIVWAMWTWTRGQERGGRAFGGDGAPGNRKGEREDQRQGAARPPYVHTVIFYLKEDAPKDQVENMIADAHRLLARIPAVKGLWIGRPAEKSTPMLAVTDYQVAMLLLFDDYAGLQEYLEHKLHLEFREKHARHAERVPVYDFVNQKR
jgi:hypothetical protein